ncbi:MAG: low molecular weight protein-tyrosine-phosphatase [Halioglobus sp.]|nr:low molecular weight protein-tyrosine-phosphatase [Halioglobus sp.]
MMISARPAVGVLLVCRANICRSPMAQALLREELKLRRLQRRVRLDSAGTHAGQPGHAADSRARQVCAREGISLRKSRARQVVARDFLRFDFILALDSPCLEWLLEAAPAETRADISLLGAWATGGGIGDIPDPYYGSVATFEAVLDMLHGAVDGFLPHLLARVSGARRRA